MSLTSAIGLALAVVLATAAGGIRTSTAYGRLVDRTDRYAMKVQDDSEGSPVLPQLPDLDGVAAADRISAGWGLVDGLVVRSGGIVLFALAALLATFVAAGQRLRGDLAVLRALGFRRRQIGVVVASHATVVGLVGAALGVPLGAVLGRLVWTWFATDARVVPDPATPIAVFAACVVAAIVVVNLIALGPAWYARRVGVARALSAA